MKKKPLGWGYVGSVFTPVFIRCPEFCVCLVPLESQELPRAHHFNGLWVFYIIVGTLSIFVRVWVGSESPDWLEGCSRWKHNSGEKSLWNKPHSGKVQFHFYQNLPAIKRCKICGWVSSICSEKKLEVKSDLKGKGEGGGRTWVGLEGEIRGLWARGFGSGEKLCSKISLLLPPESSNVLKLLLIWYRFVFSKLGTDLKLSFNYIFALIYVKSDLTGGAKRIEVRVTHLGLSAFLEVVHPNEPVCPETKLGNLWAGENFLPSFKGQLWVLSAKFEEEFLPVCTN